MRKIWSAMIVWMLFASLAVTAEQLFTGVIDTLDPRDRVIFIDRKMYRIAEDAVIENPKKEEGIMALQDLKPGQRVTFDVQISPNGEGRIVYLSVGN